MPHEATLFLPQWLVVVNKRQGHIHRVTHRSHRYGEILSFDCLRRCPPGVLQVSSRCPPSLDWDLFPIGNEIRKKLLQQIGLIGYTPRDTESLWWSQCTACQRRFQLKGSLVPRCPGSAQTGKGPPTHTSANHPHTDTEILQILYIYVCVVYIYIFTNMT